MIDKKSIKILVVDDDVQVCDMIVDLFEQTGMSVIGVYSAQEAMDIINVQEIGIVISDIVMPDKDGFWLLKEIQKRNQLFPKVLFISGKEIDLEFCYSQGIIGFFGKPFDLDEVKRAVMKCLLNRKDWLRHPINGRVGKITKKFYDWEDLVSSKQVSFGHLGLFMAESHQFFEVGSLIDFSVQFVSGVPAKKIAGQGVVRWVRKPGQHNKTPGMGLEVLHIQQDGLKSYLSIIEALESQASIPLST